MTDEELCIPRPKADWARCLPKFYPCKLENDQIKIAKYLVKLATEEVPFTIYKETGKKIGLGQYNHRLHMHLGALSWVTYRIEKVFLSVLVARAAEETPGDGFFKMVAGFREKQYEKLDNKKSFNEERVLVYNAAKEGKLDFILTGKTHK